MREDYEGEVESLTANFIGYETSNGRGMSGGPHFYCPYGSLSGPKASAIRDWVITNTPWRCLMSPVCCLLLLTCAEPDTDDTGAVGTTDGGSVSDGGDDPVELCREALSDYEHGQASGRLEGYIDANGKNSVWLTRLRATDCWRAAACCPRDRLGGRRLVRGMVARTHRLRRQLSHSSHPVRCCRP